VALPSTLSAAPRTVPVSFVVAEVLPFRLRYLWILFFVGAAPIALWIARPLLFGVVGFATVAAIYASRLRATRIRLELLKWGSVATVVDAERIGEMRSYSGRTWFNGYAPVARGWSVTRDRASKPDVKTRIRYSLGSYKGELMLTEREYIDGVVLADQRNPATALCVTAFPYDLVVDGSGNWVGTLRRGLKLGMAVWLVVVVAWLAVAAAAVAGA
jgi:hypothetical protein